MAIWETEKYREIITGNAFRDNAVGKIVKTFFVVFIVVFVFHQRHSAHDETFNFLKNSCKFKRHQHSVQRVKLLSNIFDKKYSVLEVERVGCREQCINQCQIATNQLAGNGTPPVKSVIRYRIRG